MDEKRMVGDYTVINSMYIGHREIILGENPKAASGERYVCCYAERVLFYEQYLEAQVSDDFAEIVKLYGERVTQAADEIMKETLAKFAAVGSSMSPPFDMRDFHRKFFEQCARLEKHEERILCSPSYYFYGRRLLLSGLSQSQRRYNAYEQWSPDVQEMIRRFLYVNLLDFYRQWVTSGKKMTLEELTVLSSKLMFNGLSDFIDPVPNPAGDI